MTVNKSVSRASDWRKWKEEGYQIEFPSGVVGLVRPLSLDMMLESHYIPNELIPHVEQMIRGTRAVQNGADMDMVELAKNNRKFSHAVAYASLISPRVSETPDYEANEISPDDISPEDLQFLVRWINYPASKLKKFSEDQIAGLEPVPPFGTTDVEAEPDSERG